MPKPSARIIVPRVFDLSAAPAERSREIPLELAFRWQADEPDFQRAVEVAPDVWVTLMGTGDLLRPRNARPGVAGARVAVWADRLERPLALGEAAAALGVELPTMRWWVREDYVPSWKTPGGHHRFDPAVLRAVKDGVPLGDLSGIVARVQREAARRAS